MKIGIVCYPTYGGSGIVATELGIALSKKGHQVHFITYNQPVRLKLLQKNVYFHRVYIENYPLFEYQPYELALSTKIVEVVEKYHLEILHVHYAIPHAYAAYTAKQMLKEKGIPIKIITTLHGTDISLVGSHKNYKTAVAFSINHSDAVTTVSKNLKQQTLNLFDIKKNIFVIPNFINPLNYKVENTVKRNLICDKKQRIITHVSNFRKVKRPLDVLEIFYKIQQKIPAKLMLIGEGPLLSEVKKQAKDLGIYEKIIFWGNTLELKQILLFSDLFLLPSEMESFGLAALEAMNAKTPVISTNVGGLPELNKEGITGFLSPVGDVESMKKNACKILQSDTILNTFKKNAYEHSKKFSIEKMLPLYEKIYKNCF